MRDGIHIIASDSELVPPDPKANNKPWTGAVANMEYGLKRTTIVMDADQVAFKQLTLLA